MFDACGETAAHRPPVTEDGDASFLLYTENKQQLDKNPFLTLFQSQIWFRLQRKLHSDTKPDLKFRNSESKN